MHILLIICWLSEGIRNSCSHPGVNHMNSIELMIKSSCSTIVHTGWCPPVLSWFITSIDYTYITYIYHKP